MRRREYPPTLVVRGRAHGTFATAIYRDGAWDLHDAPLVPGDGRIRWEDAVPVGMPHDEIETAREHSELLNDPLVIERILQ